VLQSRDVVPEPPFLCCFLSTAQRQQAWAEACTTLAEFRATASWPELVWIFLKCAAEITLASLPPGDLVSYSKKELKFRKKKKKKKSLRNSPNDSDRLLCSLARLLSTDGFKLGA